MPPRIAIAALLLTAVAVGAPPEPDRLPLNVVVIVSDDLGYNDPGFNGASSFRTPRLDELARAGVSFTSAYVSQPQCSPSRAGILTGLHQQRFGFEDLTGSNFRGLQPGQVTILEHLRERGYATGAVGKWHVGRKGGLNQPADKGVGESFVSLGGARAYWAVEPPSGDVMLRDGVDVEMAWGLGGDPLSHDPNRGRYLTDAVGDEAAAFIDRHHAHPFALYVAFHAIHTPLHAKQEDLGAFPNLTTPEKTVAAMTLAMDRAIGTILDTLARHGLHERTVIVFVNDNGGRAPNEAHPGDNAPFRGSKNSTWEGGIRVPMLLCGPGIVANTTYDDPVSTLDLVPTLMSLAGLGPVPSDGVDLIPHLRGERSTPPHDVIVVRHRDEWAVRRGGLKLVRPDGNRDEVFLFDLDTDPGETTDLSEVLPHTVAELELELDLFETRLDKPRWGLRWLNDDSSFRFLGTGGTSAWSQPGRWRGQPSQRGTSLIPADSCSDLRLEFPASSQSYSSLNDMARMTGGQFMANEIALTGVSAPEFLGSIGGNAVLMTESRSGDAARLRLDATGSGRFEIGLELTLLDDLVVCGDGNATFVMTGPIQMRRAGRRVIKRDASVARLQGPIDVRSLWVMDGGLELHDGGSLVAESVRIDASGALHMSEGAIVAVGSIDNDGILSGEGAFGGTIHGRGSLRPSGTLIVAGDYIQRDLTTGAPGELQMRVGDQLVVGGAAHLGGDIILTAGDGARFGDRLRVIDAGVITGDAAGIVLPELEDHLVPAVERGASWVDVTIGCRADMSPPYGVLDAFDTVVFLTRYEAADPRANLVEPDDVIDVFDLLRFLELVSTGCESS